MDGKSNYFGMGPKKKDNQKNDSAAISQMWYWEQKLLFLLSIR